MTMEGKPPGWYKDPDGLATHQAWWDGEKWTGVVRDSLTRRVTSPDRKPNSTKRSVLIAIGISLVIIVVYYSLVGF